MADSFVIEGVLRDGLQVAAQFTELPWVREQFRRKLGLDVWPGTVNLQVQDAAGLAVLARLRAAPDAPDGIPSGVPIEPPPAPAPSAATGPGDSTEAEGAAYCVGYCYPARIGDLPAAVVVPHVPDYPPDKLELIAAVRVRDALGLQPGDRVMVTVLAGDGPTPPPPLPPWEGGVDGSTSPIPLPEGEGERHGGAGLAAGPKWLSP